jgi:arylsulfatase A-like enzyme
VPLENLVYLGAMRGRDLFVVGLFVGVVCGAAAECEAALGSPTPPPQNVLLIVLDDVGTDLIGTYETLEVSQGRAPGLPASTPAIDQLLAAQGVTFSRAWTAPKCSPTRAQILTGLHPFHSGIGAIVRAEPFTGARNPGLFPEAELLPQQLRAAPTPYASAAVGKWHLGDIVQLDDDPGHALGWPHGQWFEYYAGSRFNLEAANAGSSANPYFSWRKVYASANGASTPCGPSSQACEVPVYAPPSRNYATADTAEDALALIATLPEPWFLYVSFNAVHAPYHVPPADLPTAPCLPGAGASLPCALAVTNSVVERARCMMSALDQQIGRLICASDPADTTFILIGDNGSPQNATAAPHDPLHAKGTMYEGGVRVPLIIRSPLVPPTRRGTVEPRLVCSVDLHSTVLELAGAPAANTATDGVSLVPYLVAANAPTLRWMSYSEGFFPNFRPTASGVPPPEYVCHYQNQALRDLRFKLIRRTRRDHQNNALILVSEEFYDLGQGGPPDTSVTPPAPTPDWFEQHDLLATGAPLVGAAREAYGRLSSTLATRYPSLVR